MYRKCGSGHAWFRCQGSVFGGGYLYRSERFGRKTFSDYNDMAGERVLLEVGTYKVKVTSNPSDKLEFEKPTFYGDKDKIVIKAGETTQTAIECF